MSADPAPCPTCGGRRLVYIKHPLLNILVGVPCGDCKPRNP